MRSYDCLVIGAGVFGSWIAYHLCKSGRSVALMDAYGAGNTRASSGGESRIIRMSYGPDEIYARWSLRSLHLWKRLFAEVREPGLFHRTGVLWTASEGHPRAASNRVALANCGVPFENLTHAEVEKRYPQFRFPPPITAVLEPESGVLLARRAVHAVVNEAVRLGVDFIPAFATPPAPDGRVAGIAADRFIYACGPWLPKIFPDLLTGRIRGTRQEVFFFGPPSGNRQYAPPLMPAWLDFCDPRGGYSIPDLESRGFKLAFDCHGPEVDPDTQERIVGPAAIAAARAFIGERFPGLHGAPIVETRVCQYENTSNGDFLIDRHPDYKNVWLAGGGSGHGFKHGPAVGEHVAGLVHGTVEVEPRFSLVTKKTVPDRSVY